MTNIENVLEPFNERKVNIIRGKSLMMDKSGEDIRYLCKIIDWFEAKLDDADCDDTFGTEGWRRYFGLE